MSGKPPILFEEGQTFDQLRVRLVLAIPPAAMFCLTIWHVGFGRPWGKQTMSNTSITVWTLFLCLVYLRLITIQLITRVHADRISLSLQDIWRLQRVFLSKVKSAEAVTYDPARDYGGYGIRSARRGRAYIARGSSGVSLELTKGGHILIG